MTSQARSTKTTATTQVIARDVIVNFPELWAVEYAAPSGEVEDAWETFSSEEQATKEAEWYAERGFAARVIHVPSKRVVLKGRGAE